jgi:putative ATP-dependent endonuclease of the OLD family
MNPVPAQPTNHQQHLLYAWRQKLVDALMHECVLIPEGVSDVAWLEALQTALELHQGWQDAGNGAPLLSTFVGVVPTIDAKIADTFALVTAVHARTCVLVDGDDDGLRYFDAVKARAFDEKAESIVDSHDGTNQIQHPPLVQRGQS